MKAKMERLLSEYGTAALITYFAIFALTLLGFVAAISAGWSTEGAAETTGLWFSAWVATKLTQPLRIGATIVLTPAIVAVWHRVRGRKPEPPVEAAADAVPVTPDAERTPPAP
jgi:hypothetical protein